MRTTNFTPDQNILIASGAVTGDAAAAALSDEVVLELTNRTGGTTAAGDVVVLDTANDASYVATTIPQFATGTIGIVVAPTYNGSNGRVLVRGYAPIVNVNGSNATRGHLLSTSQVGLAARLTTERTGGTFGQILSSETTPPADIWGVPDRVTTIIHSSNSLIGPVTFTTPGNSVSITMPTAGVLALQSTGGSGGSAVAVAVARYVRSSGDYTTSSTSFTDLDSTNMALTITTAARRVLLSFVAAAAVNNAAGTIGFDFLVDGARVGGDGGLLFVNQHATASEQMPISITYLTDSLSSGSHTFKVQWRVANGAHTGTVIGSSSGNSVAVFQVIEQPT